MKPDDFAYAIENTNILIPPKNAIQTYGETFFHFYLITEPMDEVGTVRLREGIINAERPRILAPQYVNKLLINGFGDQAKQFAEWLEKNVHFLRYGFSLKKDDLAEQLLYEKKESIIEKITEQIVRLDNPNSTLIEGIDDTWEVCLMKFTTDIIQSSARENISEWKYRGFI